MSTLIDRAIRRSAGLAGLLCAALTVVVVPAVASGAGTGPSQAQNRSLSGASGAGPAGIIGHGRDLTLSVSAAVVSPVSQNPNQGSATLAYVLANTGEWPIRWIALTDQLVPGRQVQCAGEPVVDVLWPHTSITCTAVLGLPPGTYTSSAQALGWECGLLGELLGGCQVSADAGTQFTIAPPPPPPSSPPPPPSSPPTSSSPPQTPPQSPPPTPVPVTIINAPQTPVPTSKPVVPTPSPRPLPTPAPSLTTPSPIPKLTPSPPPPPGSAPTPAIYQQAYRAARPAPHVRQLPTHTALLLVMFPGAVAVAASAAVGRRPR